MAVKHHLSGKCRWLIPHHALTFNCVVPVSGQVIIASTGANVVVVVAVVIVSPIIVFKAGHELERVHMLVIRVASGRDRTLDHGTQVALVQNEVLLKEMAIHRPTLQLRHARTVW